MELWSVLGNGQKLDGGAMFGNCPRALWETYLAPDEQHLLSFACRCLLVRGLDGRTVLFEAGIGAFFEPKLRARYGVTLSEHVLVSSLARLGVAPSDIDVVVLSHLHFDHAGGLLTAYEADRPPSLVFPNASYVVSEAAWSRAVSPHSRDRASFIPELPGLLAAREVERCTGPTSRLLGPSVRLRYSDGHTPGLLLSTIDQGDARVTFLSDLCPGVPWVHLPITMGYDRYPELLIDEKRALFEEIVKDDGFVFFTHDPKVAVARLQKDPKGRFVATDPVAELSGHPTASPA